MPPKADYWKNFHVAWVLATCKLPGCPKPNVSLGRLSFVNNKGFLMDKRLTVPELKVHNPEWYKDKICINSYRWWEQNEARLVAKGPAGKNGSSLSNLRLNISVLGFVKRHRYFSRQTRIDWDYFGKIGGGDSSHDIYEYDQWSNTTTECTSYHE